MPKKKECLVDWLQFTLPYSDENENAAFQMIGYYSPLKAARPLHGYGFCQKNEFGAMVMTNKNRPEMGVHVQLPGQQCQVMRDLKEDFQTFAKEILAAKGKGSRIDVTTDFSAVAFRPVDIMGSFERKERKGTARSASIIYELEGGQTIYVGSWSSDRFARIYEKTRNFGDLDEQVMRLELVNKQRYAQSALEIMAESGVAPLANAALATMDKMLGLNREDWKEMMKDKTEPMLVGRKSTSEDDSWLLNIVATAVAKRCMRIDGKGFWDKFVDAVTRKLDAMGVNREGAEND